ncbi:hypothetical protein RF11_09855 [Thelohanellus kitauei]|uniref:DUF4371 domain-containing protein n=1 Tax=Thelohanellus kitauei TaxID=669202 RepID=A0A0C2JAP5_THEKT|nr:hypothetical protein RF11_09855 [Thelohanellus kitauei]
MLSVHEIDEMFTNPLTFYESINFVLKTELMSELRNSFFHTLIKDEITDISSQKMLILYFNIGQRQTIYTNIFGERMKLTPRDCISIVTKIKFNNENKLSFQKVMFTSDDASVMLGKNNGVAAFWKGEIHNLCDKHCVSHRKD